MSVRTPYEQRLAAWVATASVVADSMTEYKWEIAKDFIVSLLLSGLAYQALAGGYSATATVAIIAIGAINTITAADVLEIVRRKKREELIDANTETGDD
jgi:hypothetical protein